MQGVYAIRCVVTGEQYVGCSRKIEKRWEVHQKGLRLGAHPNRSLQEARTTHGEAAFVFEVLRRVKHDRYLFQEEAALIHQLKPAYNHQIPLTLEEQERAQEALRQKFERAGHLWPEEFRTRKARTRPSTKAVPVGHCPGCGMALRLNYTDSGVHLEPDED
jgi:hypothetical protein